VTEELEILTFKYRPAFPQHVENTYVIRTNVFTYSRALTYKFTSF